METQVSETLGISRGTLREALRSIEIEGLLVNDGRGHMTVRELSSQQIADVFEVRTALEVVAATKLAASERRGEFADALEEVLRPLQRQDLSFGERIEVDLAFHALICELTGNTTLVGSWSHLMGQIRMMIISAGPDRAMDRMLYEEHLPIAAAIRSGDEAAVRRTLSEHMADFAGRYVTDAQENERIEESVRSA